VRVRLAHATVSSSGTKSTQAVRPSAHPRPGVAVYVGKPRSPLDSAAVRACALTRIVEPNRHQVS
jgi:hypothetical protein